MRPVEPSECSRPKRSWGAASAAEAARTSTACTACRYRKIKCSGSQPCRFCSKRQQPCVFPETAKGKKRLYSVAYVDDLERQVASWKSQLRLGDNVESPPDQPHSPQEGQSEVSRASSDRQSALIPEPDMTSSLQFGTRIKRLSKDSAPILHQGQQHHHQHLPEPARESQSPDDAYNLLSWSGKHGASATALQWPTEEKAQALLETFLNSLGTVQHLLDARDFSDRIAALYGDQATQISMRTLWHVEFMLVMAIGELLQGSTQQNTTLPGVQYFQEAVNHLPGVASLRSSGILAVETMGLAAFYLQCADCKEDAYVYAGLGLRLGVSSGIARQEGHGRTSDATHRNRLWWTIYMQERRLAAATGNPVGINDDAITTPLPVNKPGFQPADALRTNIKLARITGSVTQDIYGRRHQSEREFILQIQKILASISEIQKCMPSDYAVDLSDESRSYSRTGATLYLMLFQAVMLVTRPTLLYMAKSRLQKEPQAVQGGQAEISLLEKLYRPCVEAARHTLTTIDTVRKQGILAEFGFFDLDALFSAAFVFVMAELAGIGASTVPEIRHAVALLGHLKSLGNKAAGNRLADICQMCARLEISIHCPSATEMGIRNSQEHHDLGGTVQGGQNDTIQTSWTDRPWSGFDEFLSEGLDMAALDEGHLDFPALWQDHDLGLDGTVETDWGELERVASQFQQGSLHEWSGL